MSNADINVDEIDDGYPAALSEMKGVDAAAVTAQSPGRGPERMLDLEIRTGPFGDRYGEKPDELTLQAFRDEPHGIYLGPMVPPARELLNPPSGKIELAPEYITADVHRLAASRSHNGGLLLVCRRHLRSNNSWMHNVTVLVKSKDRSLLIHPEDAERAGVRDGAVARVSSEAGSVDVPVEVSDEMMPGVVSLPHGWGDDKDGTRMSVAREHAGVNNNRPPGPPH